MKQTPNIGRPRDSLLTFREGAQIGDLPDPEFPVEFGGLSEPIVIEGGAIDSLQYPPRGSAGVVLTGQAVGYGGYLYRTNQDIYYGTHPPVPGVPSDRSHDLVIPTSVQEGDTMFVALCANASIGGYGEQIPAWWEGWTPVFHYGVGNGAVNRVGNLGLCVFTIYSRIARAEDVGKTLLTSHPLHRFYGNEPPGAFTMWVAHLRAYQCGGIDKVGYTEDGFHDPTLAYTLDRAAPRQVNFFPYFDEGDDFGVGYHHDQGFFPLLAGSSQPYGIFPWPVIPGPVIPGSATHFTVDLTGPHPFQGPRVLLFSEEFDTTMLQQLKLWKNKGGSFGSDPATGIKTSPTGFEAGPAASGDGTFGQAVSTKGVALNDAHMQSFRVSLTLKNGTLSPPTPTPFTLVHSAAPGAVGDWTVPTDEGALAVISGVLTANNPDDVTIYSVNNDNAAPFASRGDKYAAKYTAVGQSGDNSMCRLHFIRPQHPGEQPNEQVSIVFNLRDRLHGLAFCFGGLSTGWLKDNLGYLGVVEALVTSTRPTPLYQQDPVALESKADLYMREAGAKIPGLLLYPADMPPASPPYADADLMLGPTEYWLELWRHGTTYQGRVYVNDPDLYGPVYTSKFTVASGDPDYGPAATGHWGFTWDSIGRQDDGIKDIKIFSQP